MPNRFSGSSNHLVFTTHALQRMAQRGFTSDDVSTIVRYGHCMELEDGYHLLSIQFSPFAGLAAGRKLDRLTDCSAVVSGDGAVITVYRNDERCPSFRTVVIPE